MRVLNVRLRVKSEVEPHLQVCRDVYRGCDRVSDFILININLYNRHIFILHTQYSICNRISISVSILLSLLLLPRHQNVDLRLGTDWLAVWAMGLTRHLSTVRHRV